MLRLVAGLCLTFGTWLALRRLVRARPAVALAALLLDALPVALGFALVLLATARPLLSGLAVASLGFGLGLTDRMKRKILREPVVFADRAELLDVVRHPRFYIAFVGTVPMVAGATALILLIAAIVHFEPPLWSAGIGGALASIAAAILIGRLAFVLPATAPLRDRLAAIYLAWGATRDPAADSERFGLLAGLVVQATIARAERPRRRAAAQAGALPGMAPNQGPIIFWQAESFADVGRLDAECRGRLPNYERLKHEASLSGRLTVPAWGANTIRTELAAIAGIGPQALGLDWYNPYDAFVEVPLPSLAASARAAGYTTICVHPYSRTFYARDKVMPLLGFDRFIGIEAFAGAERDTGYVTDRALARFVADLVARAGEKLFVFVISIENHGPWDAKHDGLAPAVLPAAWAGKPDAAEAARWLRHVEATDGAVGILREAIDRAGHGWIGFYGDHQPSLSGPFEAHAGDRGTDYVLWRKDAEPNGSQDLAAEDLARVWLELMARSAAE